MTAAGIPPAKVVDAAHRQCPHLCPFAHRQKLNNFAGLRPRVAEILSGTTALRHVIRAALSTAVSNLRLRPISAWWRAGAEQRRQASYDMRQLLPAQDSRNPDCGVGSRERSVAESGDHGSAQPDRLRPPRPRRMGAIRFWRTTPLRASGGRVWRRGGGGFQRGLHVAEDLP